LDKLNNCGKPISQAFDFANRTFDCSRQEDTSEKAAVARAYSRSPHCLNHCRDESHGPNKFGKHVAQFVHAGGSSLYML
jgi:hypothetical protein